VKQGEAHAAACAVRARKHAAGPEHASHLCEQPVLRLGARYVVEHREAGGAAERAVAERHARAITLYDLDTFAEPLSQRASQRRVHLQCRQPGGAGGQGLGGGAEARPHFQDVVAELHTVERGRHEILADVPLPGLAAAVPVVRPVHSGERLRRSHADCRPARGAASFGTPRSG